MFKKYFLFFIINCILAFISCKNGFNHSKKTNLNEIDTVIRNQIKLARKQLFINFLYRHENFKKVIQEDGSLYYDNCGICPALWKDSKLKEISDNWFKKNYSDEIVENKNLFIIKSLEFMMSEDIDNYLDSVKVIVTKDPESFDIIGKINKHNNLKEIIYE